MHKTTLMAIATAAALTPTGALAGPTVDVTAPASSPSARSGGFHVEPNAIKGARGASVVFNVGDRAGHSYCNAFGPGTRIAAARVLAKRWHSQPLTGSLRVLAENGVAWSRTHSQLGYQQAHNLWVPAVSAGCVAIEWRQTGRSLGGAGWNPIFTAQLTHLRIEDLQGPAVANPETSLDWATGDSVTISWNSSDNALFRGETGVTLPGGAALSRGVAANGPVSAAVDISRVGDGVTSPTVWRRSAGWPTATATFALRVDRTPPSVPAVQAPSGWTRSARVTAAPSADATSGWRENQIRIGTGGWTALPAAGVVLADGAHTVAVRATDRAGNVSGAVSREVRVDATPPTAKLSARVSAPGTASFDLTGTSDGGSGIAGWVVRRGAADGPVVATSSEPTGLAAVRAPDGEHRFHLLVKDRAGNTAETATPPLRFDSTPPSVRISRLPSGWIDGFRAGAGRDTRLGIEVGDERADGLGPVQVQLRQGASWRVIARYNEPGVARLGSGKHLLDIDLDLPGIESGPAEIRVVAMDPSHAALRSVTQARRVKLDLDAIDFAAFGVPSAGKAGAVLDEATGSHYWTVTSVEGVSFSLWDMADLAPPTLRLSGTRVTQNYRGRRVPVRKIAHRGRFSVSGRVVSPRGVGLPGITVLMRDPQRRTITRATTGAKGGFVLRGRATRGGLWAVEAVGRGRLVSRFSLKVRPRIGLQTSRRKVRAGGSVLLKGAVKPRVGSYGKVVQLQFRDGRRWRPFANARVDRKGQFRHRYTFRRAGGYSVRIRAVILRQADWPFTPGATRPVTVAVG